MRQRRNTDILLGVAVYSGKNSRRRITMRGLRAKRITMLREGTLIATVDVGMTSNTGYCTTTDSREELDTLLHLPLNDVK